MNPTSILESILFSTIQINLYDNNNVPNGHTGTGFLINVPVGNDGLSAVFLVSNKHVFNKGPKFQLNFHCRKPNELEPDLGKIFPHLTTGHENAYFEHPNP
ncbi:hypothetical protein KKF86_02725 [bacterium]|nr:hypothetical protein [bacterium]